MQTEGENMSVNITIQPTPNPNALKFILDKFVKTVGSSSYKSPLDAKDNQLASALFTIRGIDQIHFFENVITVSKFGFEDWDSAEPQVIETIQSMIVNHNPDYHDSDPEAERRMALTPDLLKIEEILDRTVRPGLQGDGGDLKTLSYNKEDHVLMIKYQGACGSCPSSSTGTLEAIKSILRDEFDPELDVYIAPE